MCEQAVLWVACLLGGGSVAYVLVPVASSFPQDMICDAEGHTHVGMCEPVDMNVCALT